MRIELSVTAGPHEGEEFTFDRHRTAVVGRGGDVQCPMPGDKFLSRHHFLLEVHPPLCSFRDLGSTNGTKVNGVRVERTMLHHGDVITAGQSSFRVGMEFSTGAAPIVCRSCGNPAPPDLGIAARPGEGLDWVCDICRSDRRRHFPRPPEGYFIERLLGSGGMGDVFLVRRLADNVPMALKVMMPIVAASERAKQYFLREMNVLRNLRHRNIVTFHGAIESDGQFQLLMEYVDGKGAAHWVGGLDGPVPIASAAQIGLQLLLALDHAHGRGYVHRDIKPSNVLVMGSARKPFVKLSDFGLAKNFRDDAGFGGLTTEGDFGGSMGFLSPDHIREFREVREPADIYSAGATLYYLLSRHYPFLDFDPRRADAIAMTLEHPSLPLRARRPDAPEELERILKRALEKDPADRWPSAASMAEALRPFAVDPLADRVQSAVGGDEAASD